MTNPFLLLLLFLSCAGAATRDLCVYLPPGYDSTANYPVLYLHDGQNLFDTLATHDAEWRVDETLDSMIAARDIEPLIVIGIPHAQTYRRAEYVSQDVLERLDDGTRAEFLQLIAQVPRSREYLQELTETVIPQVDSLYATDTTRRFIGGSSTGAVGALNAALAAPELFDGVMCFSTHWSGLFRQNTAVPQAYLELLDDRLPPPSQSRWYFDHGDQGLDSLYAPHQLRVDSLFRAHGYDSATYRSRAFPGHTHHERDWAKRFGAAIRWMLRE